MTYKVFRSRMAMAYVRRIEFLQWNVNVCADDIEFRDIRCFENSSNKKQTEELTTTKPSVAQITGNKAIENVASDPEL